MSYLDPHRLIYHRQRAGLTLEEAAHDTAIAPALLVRYEAGKIVPSDVVVATLAARYGCSLVDFYSASETDGPSHADRQAIRERLRRWRASRRR